MTEQNRKRAIKIQFYLGEKEYRYFKETEHLSGEINRREFILSLIKRAENEGAFKKQIMTIPDDLSEVIFQMKQIGNNLNQIAFILNKENRISELNLNYLNQSLIAVSEFRSIGNRIKKHVDKY